MQREEIDYSYPDITDYPFVYISPSSNLDVHYQKWAWICETLRIRYKTDWMIFADVSNIGAGYSKWSFTHESHMMMFALKWG